MNGQPNNTPKDDVKWDEESTATLTKRQWTVIFNVLVSQKYAPGDGEIVMKILRIIEPLAALAQSPIAPPAPPKLELTKNN